MVALVINERTWDREVQGSSTPVLVDFWAPRCAPCRALSPTIDALATQFAGKVKVAKLDVDDNPEVAARYNVQSIPTLLLFRGGRVVEQRVGVPSRGQLVSMLEDLIE